MHIQVTTGFSIAAFLMVIASLFLLLDFHAPWVVWRVMLTPFASLISFGACIVALFTVTAVAIAAAALTKQHIPAALLWFARIGGTLLAFSTMLYAGLFFTSMVSVDVWHTWLLPLLFVASSLSCGLAALTFMETFFPGESPGHTPSWWQVQPLVAALEAALLAAFVLERASFSPTAHASIISLIMGEYAPLFWLGIVLAGILMPLVAHVLHHKIPLEALTQTTAAGILVGGFLLRHCIVGIALYTPLFPS